MNNFALSLLLAIVFVTAFCCCVDGKKNPAGKEAPGTADVEPSKRAAGIEQGTDFLTGAAFSAHASEDFNTSHDTRIPYDVVDLSTPEGLFDVETNSFSPGVGNGGVWKFSASVEGIEGDQSIGVYIYKNDVPIKRAYAIAQNSLSIAADVVAYIEENEVVYATLCCPGVFAGGISTTFSGFLISRDLPEPPPVPRRSY